MNSGEVRCDSRDHQSAGGGGTQESGNRIYGNSDDETPHSIFTIDARHPCMHGVLYKSGPWIPRGPTQIGFSSEN